LPCHGRWEEFKFIRSYQKQQITLLIYLEENKYIMSVIRSYIRKDKNIIFLLLSLKEEIMEHKLMKN
jgi:hypothetical protein